MDPRRHRRPGRGRLAAWRLVAALTLLLAGTLLSQTLAQAEGEEQVGVSTGVYTEAQAESGAALFARHCASCHGATLGGGMGPRLAPLETWWRDRNLVSLVNFVRGNMPMTAPGSLAAEEYSDIVAFILASNGYPAGEIDLSTDVEALAPFVLDEPPTE